MNSERLESLLWECRDGTITAEERAEIVGYLEQHPEARELQREIEELSERLDGLDRASPPRDLRPRIAQALAGVPTPKREAQQPSSAIHHVAKWRPTHWLPLAASLLVGVAVGYILQPANGVSVDASRAAGTMGATSLEHAAQRLDVDLEDPTGTIAIRRRGRLAAITVELAADTDLEIEMEVADGYLLLTGIDRDDATGFDVSAANGKTVFRTRGPASRTLEFTATIPSSPVRLIVRADGLVVADDWLAGQE